MIIDIVLVEIMFLLCLETFFILPLQVCFSLFLMSICQGIHLYNLIFYTISSFCQMFISAIQCEEVFPGYFSVSKIADCESENITKSGLCCFQSFKRCYLVFSALLPPQRHYYYIVMQCAWS